MAADLLEAANKEADRGNYDASLISLEEAHRIAVRADDPLLRVKTALSRGNVFFAVGRPEEAAVLWQAALDEAEAAEDRELVAFCRVTLARGRLLSASKAGGEAQSVRDEVKQELSNIKKDRVYAAFAWTVIALAEKDLRHYKEAEAAVRNALAIYEKDLYLEQAAYSWFLIASIRSVSGDYAGSKAALEQAVNFDRRSENSWGLAADWRALGDVNTKDGKTSAAKAAYLRAAEIYSSLDMDQMAAAMEKLAG
jgi:tetratricopeptide (TPR) repeat protein